MAKFVLAYQGGGGMAETEAEQAAVYEKWGAWFQELGDSVVDSGNPFGQSRTIGASGDVTVGGQLTGYSIISANDIDAAVTAAKGCPVLESGGSVEVAEAIDM